MTPNKEECLTISIPAENIAKEDKVRLELLYEVGKKVATASQMTQLVERIILMTQRTLNATASSLLLFCGKEQELSEAKFLRAWDGYVLLVQRAE